MKRVLFVLDYNTFYDSLIEKADIAHQCGAAIWLRIKNITSEKIYEYAQNLRKKLPDAHLILSERADIAYLCGFEGVHLNKSCYPAAEVKTAFPGLQVGYSAHSLYEITSVKADYYTLSPVFKAKDKKGSATLGHIKVGNFNEKIYALGGINKNNAETAKKLGFYGIAGISLIDELALIKERFYP